MFRTFIAFTLAIGLTSAALAQGIRPIGPPPQIGGLGALSNPSIGFNNYGYSSFSTPYYNNIGYNNYGYNNIAFGNLNTGYGNGGWYLLPYQVPYYVPVPYAVPVAQPQVTQSTSRKVSLADSPTPAKFALKFPVKATVWLNGEKQKGTKREWTLSAPDAIQSYQFDVRAQWTIDGKEYEWKRNTTVEQGGTASATVARGFPVKK